MRGVSSPCRLRLDEVLSGPDGNVAPVRGAAVVDGAPGLGGAVATAIKAPSGRANRRLARGAGCRVGFTGDPLKFAVHG
jgi:hypothetical protein